MRNLQNKDSCFALLERLTVAVWYLLRNRAVQKPALASLRDPAEQLPRRGSDRFLIWLAS